MKSGDIAMLRNQYCTTTFLPTPDEWAHDVVIHCGDLLLILDEDVLRTVRVFKAFHCASGTTGFIRPEKLYKVNA